MLCQLLYSSFSVGTFKWPDTQICWPKKKNLKMVSFSYLELTPSLEFFKSKFLCTLHVKMAKILDDQGTRIVFMHDLGTVESAYLRLFNSFSHAKLNKLRLKTVFVPHQDSRSSGLYSLSFHFSLCLPLVH